VQDKTFKTMVEIWLEIWICGIQQLHTKMKQNWRVILGWKF